MAIIPKKPQVSDFIRAYEATGQTPVVRRNCILDAQHRICAACPVVTLALYGGWTPPAWFDQYEGNALELAKNYLLFHYGIDPRYLSNLVSGVDYPFYSNETRIARTGDDPYHVPWRERWFGWNPYRVGAALRIWIDQGLVLGK
jgi:hypothetical protein